MTSYPAERDPQRPPRHPGALLREDILPAVGLPKTVFARRLGISRQILYDILAERQPVTPPVALRLARLVGGSAALWLGLQQKHDLAALELAMSGRSANRRVSCERKPHRAPLPGSTRQPIAGGPRRGTISITPRGDGNGCPGRRPGKTVCRPVLFPIGEA